MKNIFIATFAFLLLSNVASCKKEDSNSKTNSRSIPECERLHYGTFAVDNYRSDPYKIYLNNSLLGTVSARGYKEFPKIASKVYTAKYVQASGYILYPTEITKSIKIDECYRLTVNL